MFAEVHQDFVQELVAAGFPYAGDPGGEFGPSGIVFLSDEDWMVADGGTGDLYRLGEFPARADRPLHPGAGVLDLALGPDRKLYGTRWLKGDIVEIDPATGAVTRVVAEGFSALTGMALDPLSGALLVADYQENAIYEVAPDTGLKRVRASGGALGGPDGVAISLDGHLFAACEGNKHVVEVHPDGTVIDLAVLEGGPDGIALGGPEGPLDGCVIISLRDGTVVALRPDGTTTTLAAGGTPGDLLAVDRHGRLYVTQLEEVIRLSPGWFAPSYGRTLDAAPAEHAGQESSEAREAES